MHLFANPALFIPIAKPFAPALLWPGLLFTLAACIWGVFFTSAERRMGDTVQILFEHVPAASLGMGGDGVSITFTVQDQGRSQKADLGVAACSWPIACAPSMTKTTYPKNWLTSI
jgi:heme exporter protein C